MSEDETCAWKRQGPAVSVVLLIYNRAEVLERTIESILAQTFPDFELLLCDDCSTDTSGEICQKYAAKDHRVRYVPSHQNCGMPDNLNRGIGLARGTYIANLHDGDEYAPTLLELWKAALDRCPKAAFVFNAYSYETREGRRRVEVLDVPECGPGKTLLDKYFFRRWRMNSPVFGTVMARRASYEATEPFDRRFGPLADVDMWMRLAAEHHVAYVREPLIHLPNKRTVPTRLRFSLVEKQRWLEKMYLEARRRRYGPGVRRSLELGRHACFASCRRVLLPLVVVARKFGSDVGTSERP